MTDSAAQSDVAGAARRIVLRNTLFLTLSQAVTMPISLLLNAVTARYLGVDAIAYMYLGTTFNTFAFLGVEWGQTGALPAMVATDRSKAATFLGSALVWRTLAAFVAFAVLYGLSHVLGYDSNFREVLALLFASYFLGTVVNTGQAITTGLERTDIAALRNIGEQLASAVIVIPILMLGGTLRAALVGYIFAMVPPLLVVGRALRSLGVKKPAFDTSELKSLLSTGTPFLFVSLAMVLQPSIDAVFLSKLAPVEVVGWYSAARKLIGLLVFPIAALIGALYPTLCRLYASDEEAFRKTSSASLVGSSVLAAPIALGCALFPDIGVTLYSRAEFGPTATNLQVLAIFVFLLYFTMPLSVAILASGKRREWAVVQSLCVVVSTVLDPLIIPPFQRLTNNGGLGICVSSVLSEVAVVLIALRLAPRGLFDRKVMKTLGLTALAGAVMAAVARLLHSFNSFLVAPIAVAAYFGTLWQTGGIDESITNSLRDFVKRKLK